MKKLNLEVEKNAELVEELDNVCYSDNKDDDEIKVNSKKLITRGCKVLSRDEVRKILNIF